MVATAQIGMDIRPCAPDSHWPDPEIKAQSDALAAANGGQIKLTTDAMLAVKNCDLIDTDVWVSKGEPDAVWAERIKLLTPYRVTPAVMAATGNPHTKFMHCLPAFHNRDTEVGEATFQKYDIDCMEVIEEVFKSPASVAFDQAENRLHTINAVLVGTLGA